MEGVNGTRVLLGSHDAPRAVSWNRARNSDRHPRLATGMACVGRPDGPRRPPMVTTLVTTVNPRGRKCMCRRLVQQRGRRILRPVLPRAPVADPPASCRLPKSVIRHARPADPAGRAPSRSAPAGQPQRQEGVVRPSRPRPACRTESGRLKTGTTRVLFGSRSPRTPKKSPRSRSVGSASATRTNFHTPWEEPPARPEPGSPAADI